MSPTNTNITCHQGKGSLIDYMVISNDLAPYVHSFEADPAVPWGTHDGLRLELGKIPAEVMVNVWDRPKPLPMKPCPGEDFNEEYSWEQAKVDAEETRRREGTRPHKTCKTERAEVTDKYNKNPRALGRIALRQMQN